MLLTRGYEIERTIDSTCTGMNSLMTENASCVLLTRGCAIERKIDSTRTGMNSLMAENASYIESKHLVIDDY